MNHNYFIKNISIIVVLNRSVDQVTKKRARTLEVVNHVLIKTWITPKKIKREQRKQNQNSFPTMD